VAGHFPDGQLYVNLRGFDLYGSVLEPGAALRGFLEALGVPADRVPATVQGQAALYRSLLAGRRVLVVLDNARDVEQVRELLPAAAGCAVIITSRNCVTGLVVSHGAEPTTLDVLSTGEAREAMVRRLGPDRVRAEPDAIEEIVQSCGRLPLALAVVAGRAIAHQAFSLAAIATELQSSQGSLDAFAGGDPQTDVRSVFSWSYRLLSSAAARVFRLLSAHGGPDISLPALASLAGLARRDARALLVELAEARLLVERHPGRYLMHDLVRAYARDLSHDTDTEEDRDQARRRVLDHYLQTAYATSTVLRSYRTMARPADTPRPGVTPEAPVDRIEVYAWFTAEHQVLLTTIREAADAGISQDACQLALAMQDYLHSTGNTHDWESIMRTVIAAGERAGDRASAAWARRSLAGALVMQRRYDEAAAELRCTVEQFDELGYRHEHAYLQTNLGAVASLRGRHTEAIEHLRRARTLHASDDNAHGVGRALLEMATCQSRLGRYRESVALAEEALATFIGLNQPNAMGDCWLVLGTSQAKLGAFADAARSLQRAVELWRDIGIQTGEATALMQLAEAHLEAGDGPAARAARQQALALNVALLSPEADAIRARLDRLGWPDGTSQSLDRAGRPSA
jgi:tetratricopeptide (TPR) repeat protein